MVLGGPSCPQNDLWWSMVAPEIKFYIIETHKVKLENLIGFYWLFGGFFVVFLRFLLFF